MREWSWETAFPPPCAGPTLHLPPRAFWVVGIATSTRGSFGKMPEVVQLALDFHHDDEQQPQHRAHQTARGTHDQRGTTRSPITSTPSSPPIADNTSILGRGDNGRQTRTEPTYITEIRGNGDVIPRQEPKLLASRRHHCLITKLNHCDLGFYALHKTIRFNTMYNLNSYSQ